MKKDIIPELDSALLGSCSKSIQASSNVCKWNNMFAEGKLTFDTLREYWFHQIPEKYAAQPLDDDNTTSNLKVSHELIEELEEFIHGGDKEAMKEYRTRLIKNVPSICAKPFNNGEPSYNCKECSTDETCVMCVDCFQQSIHRFHKYKMGTSAGGGFCDCGDTEAWKIAPFCDIHVPPVQDDASGTEHSLDSDRCKFAFSLIVKFALEVINKSFSTDMRFQLSSKQDITGKYLVVMYNDEVHTFDQVIHLLVQVIRCTTRQGLELASKINKDGRAVITSNGYQQCCEIKTEIERLSSQDGNKSLEVAVLPFSVVAYQSFALDFLCWLKDITKACKELRAVIVDVLTDASPNLLDSILLQAPELWKFARKQWNLVICSGMLLEKENKLLLGIHYVKNYHGIMQNYVIDDEDNPFSVASLSVQLFTVPSIAFTLISDYNAYKIILDFLIIMSLNQRNFDGKLDLSWPQTFLFERALTALHDVRFLLCSPPTIWSANLRNGFILGTSLFFEFLTCVEGMDAVKRQLGSHIEFEPEWEKSFKLLFKMFPVIKQLYVWSASDRSVLIEIYKMVLIKLNSMYSSSLGVDTLKSFGPYAANCITFNGTSETLATVHLPLTRFFGNLHLYLGDHGMDFNSEELDIWGKPHPLLLTENAVRVRSLVSQFNAGMWRKNGSSLASQMYLYHNTKFREMMLDMDITVLQMGASLIDPNAFMINVLYKFGILDWNEHGINSSIPETDSNNLRILAEEFLNLMIVLVSERYQVGVGDVNHYDCVKYEMTHLLTIKPMPHSELMKSMSSKWKSNNEQEDVIKDIAVLKTEDNTSGRSHYELKEGYPCFYNTYFFHFTKEQMFKSEKTMKERHRKLYNLNCCPPPELPSFATPFSKVRDLLNCGVMLRVIKIILSSYMSQSDNTSLEGQLDKALFLIGLALREDDRQECPLGFARCAQESDILKLLVELYCNPRCKEHRDMLKWLLDKYQDIIQNWAINETIMEYERNEESSKQQQPKSALAQKARENIMAQMKSMQEKFANKNANSFSPGKAMPADTIVQNAYVDSCIMDNRVTVTCMLCQEDEAIDVDGRPVVLAVYIQLSTVLVRDKKLIRTADEEAAKLYLTSNLGPSPYLSTCGHSMHAECFVSWRVEAVRRSHNSAPAQPASVDSSKEEYLCPLCGCISNAVLLYSPTGGLNTVPSSCSDPSYNFAQWMQIVSTVLHVTKHNPRRVAQEAAVSPESYSSSSFRIEDLEDIKAFTFRLEEPDSSRANAGCNTLSFLGESAIQDDTGSSVSSGEGWVLKVKKFTNESFGSELLLNCNRLPRDGMYWINDLSNRINATFTGRKPVDAADWSPNHLWKTAAYTIHSIEVNLRHSQRPLLGAFSRREKECLSNLIRMAFSMGECNQARVLINKYCLTSLSYLVEYECGNPCVLDWDCFGMLILLLVSAPTIVHVDNPVNIIHSIAAFLQRLLLTAQIAQCLLTMEVIPAENHTSADTECLLVLARSIRRNNSEFDTEAVWEELKDELKPFLRCCAILKHFQCPDIDAQALDTHGSDTFENLCLYLHLPVSCKELLEGEVVQSLFVSWAQHPNLSNPQNDRVFPVLRTLRINELVALPHDYSELLNTVRYFSCPTSNLDDSHNPTMCLVCGEILCSLSYCCQKELFNRKVGACTYHAHYCGGGAGIFLEIRKCQLMMFAGAGRGCFKAPPYLDDHGETDQGLRRGNKLQLCQKSYKKLQLTWLSHGVYEEVSNVIERDGLTLNNWQFY